jgi:hypothetical protein
MDVLLAKIAVGRAIVRCAANGKPGFRLTADCSTGEAARGRLAQFVKAAVIAEWNSE